MATGIWVIVSVVIAAVIIIGILIWRGKGPEILSLFVAIWNSRLGRHILLAVALILTSELLKSYTSYTAELKASEWLTSYNGTATTDAVGPIRATVSGLIADSDASSTPTPSPTSSPTPVPTPTPGASNSSSPEQSSVRATSPSLGSSTNSSEGLPSATPTPTPTPNPTPTESERKRIEAQLRIIQDRAKHHGTVMAYFYVKYVVSIMMVMGAGLVVAITLFFIAQGGWTGTNSYVRTIFIIASASAAFYGLFPSVFQQQKNITDNKQLFLKYKSLESEVDSYPVTLLDLLGQPKTPKEFINHIDSEMARLGDIALGFDITKVSYQEAINLQTSKASPTPTPTSIQSPP